MQVAVNGRCLFNKTTGVQRYTREILRCMDPDLHLIQPREQLSGATGHTWEQLILPRLLHKGELLWSPANTGPIRMRNQVLTLHDLSPLEHPEWFKPLFSLWYRLFLPILARRVRLLAVPSQYTRRKCLSRFAVPPQQVAVVPGGVDLRHFKPSLTPTRRWPSRYVLFLGSLQPRKNLASLTQVWHQLASRYRDCWLLIAGAPSSIFRREALPEGLERLCLLGYVSESELPTLYSGAQAFVLPSIDEGFGLPILEAMACGTPVIAASAGALPEVAGDAALFFNPNQPQELACQLELLLQDENLRGHLSAQGLSRVRAYPWEDSALRLQEIFQACL
jgi:glycosyltransferase involved in cell wall biosynthesis